MLLDLFAKCLGPTLKKVPRDEKQVVTRSDMFANHQLNPRTLQPPEGTLAAYHCEDSYTDRTYSPR